MGHVTEVHANVVRIVVHIIAVRITVCVRIGVHVIVATIAVYVTADAGASWRRLDRGLPRSQAWFTVLRQAMCIDAHARPGLYFGTTAGEVWASSNGGESWRCLLRHLPEIYSVTHAS